MQIEEGAVVVGKIIGLTDFGAFVELEGEKTGMIHISEVAASYVKDINEYLSMGQEVRSKVISIAEDGKISLSIRKLDDQPKEKRDRRLRKSGGERRSAPQVWNGPKNRAPEPGEKQSFEDMMARFKQVSDEKMTDLKRASDSKRGGGGYSRRGGK